MATMSAPLPIPTSGNLPMSASSYLDYDFYIGYVTIVAGLHIAMKAYGRPVQVSKNAMVLYNAVQVAMSAYIVWGLWRKPWGENNLFGFNSPDTPSIRYFVWLHYLNKWTDIMDTVLIIIRCKWQQLSFLHVVHHLTIGPVWWLVLHADVRCSAYCFGAFMNSLIHAIMYTHYLITALGMRNPFKRYVTHCQMSQFTICMMQAFYSLFFAADKIPRMLSVIQVLYMGMMLVLFTTDVYWAAARAKKAKEAEKAAKGDPKPAHITIKGEVVDCTSWADSHPGGNIIYQYHEVDASVIYEVFHQTVRSRAILKSLPRMPDKKPAMPTGEDLLKFTDSLKAKGFFKQNYGLCAAWAFGVLSALGAGFAVAAGASGWLQAVVGGVIVGCAWAQCGFLQHHSGHLALTAEPWVDYLVQTFFEGFCKGGSARWWRNRHNKHHAMPNMIGQDGDLQTTPFFAWDPVLAQKIPTPLLKIQHLLFLPMLFLYVPVFFMTTKRFMYRKGYWDEIGVVSLHFMFFYHLFFHVLGGELWSFLTVYSIGYGVQGLYLGFYFAINHFAEQRIEDKHLSYDEWQMRTAVNWGCQTKYRWFNGIASGFLNYQIEHHLWPGMPPFNYPEVAKLTQKYGEEKKLPYVDMSFGTAVKHMFQGMKDTTATELARRKELKASKKNA